MNIGRPNRDIWNQNRGPAKSRRDFAGLHVNVDTFLSKKLLVSPCEKTKNRFFCAKIALSLTFEPRYLMPSYHATYNFYIPSKISLKFCWSSIWIRNCVTGTRDIAFFRSAFLKRRYRIDFRIDSEAILSCVGFYEYAPYTKKCIFLFCRRIYE